VSDYQRLDRARKDPRDLQVAPTRRSSRIIGGCEASKRTRALFGEPPTARIPTTRYAGILAASSSVSEAPARGSISDFYRGGRSMRERERERERERGGGREEKEEDWRRDFENFVKERPETRRNRRTSDVSRRRSERGLKRSCSMEALSSKALEIRVLPRSRL